MIMLTALRTWGCRAALGLLLSGCTAAPEASAPMLTKAEVKAASGPVANETGLPDAEKLLADSVEAMGGAAKFDALKSYYEETQVSMGKLGLTGVGKLWWRGGDWYSELEMPGVGLTRTGSVGGKPWGDDPINGVRAVSGKEAEQAAWTTALCLACEWKRHFKTAETTAVKEVEGKQIAEVTLTTALGDRVVMRFDLASKLPDSQTFTQASPLGDTPVTVHFKDFRAVEGLNLPYQQVVDATLMEVVSTRSRIDFDVPVEDSRFAMPGAGPNTVTPGMLGDGAKIDPEQAAAAKAAAAEKPVKVEKRKSGKG